MNLNNFTKTYNEARCQADDAIRYNLKLISDGIPVQLLEAMEYALFSGGKRVRPVLVNWVANLGSPDETILSRTMAAVEFIHTYSLIHDDLPSMDDDDLRRGKPSLHKEFSENIAILAGDALLTEAFFLLGDTGNSILVKILSSEAGASGMVGGQVLDIKGEADIEYINNLKTARLFRACAAMGAVAGGMDKEEIDKIASYGINIGKAFQLKDDIMDNEASAEKAYLKARIFVDAAKEKIKGFKESEKLVELAEFIIRRKK